jgi:hypothetical protein
LVNFRQTCCPFLPTFWRSSPFVAAGAGRQDSGQAGFDSGSARSHLFGMLGRRIRELDIQLWARNRALHYLAGDYKLPGELGASALRDGYRSELSQGPCASNRVAPVLA